MDNYFKWFGICKTPIVISQYGLDSNKILLNPGDLIKVSPQSMPHDRTISLITLYNHRPPNKSDAENVKIYLCSESCFEIVDEDIWPYLIVETDSVVRQNIYRKRHDVLALRTGEMIYIYVNLSSARADREMKISCTIQYIGEVPEYGQGIFFCLRAMRNFKFPRNRQARFIGKYAKGYCGNLIIVTAGVFFDVMKFADITNRPIVLKETPSNQIETEIQNLQARLHRLKMKLSQDS